MGNNLELYFGTTDDVDTMVATLGALLDVRFEPSRATYATYAAHQGRRHYDLELQHGEDEDDPEDDLPFTAMPHVLTLRGDRDMDAELEQVGRALIEQFQHCGYVPARLLFAVTKLLASAD